jgi:hypothetical protein
MMPFSVAAAVHVAPLSFERYTDVVFFGEFRPK